MDNIDLLLKEAFELLAKEEYENCPNEIPKHRFSLRFPLEYVSPLSDAGKD